MKKPRNQSLPKKLSTLKIGESMVLFGKDYKDLMRQIGVLTFRNLLDGEYSVKKAHVIIGKDDELKIGVIVTRNQ